MPKETCAALIGAYPVLFLAIMFESRTISKALRDTNAYTLAVSVGSMIGVIGFGLSVWGAGDGLSDLAAVAAWCAVILTTLSIASILLTVGYQEDVDQGRGLRKVPQWVGRWIYRVKPVASPVSTVRAKPSNPIRPSRVRVR